MSFPSWKYNASTAGIVYLHFNLWGSLITTSLAVYIFALGASDQVLVPCAVLLILASVAALAYGAFHQRNARKRRLLLLVDVRGPSIRRPVYIAIRLSIAVAMLWLICSGWNMIIAARQPICVHKTPKLRLWQTGGTCMAQRAGTAFSMINLLSACATFAHMATTTDPFESHLFGKIKDRPTTVTPYIFSGVFRSSRDKRLAHKRSASTDSIRAEKPLPKIPSLESRPLTPTVDPVGLGIWAPVDLPVSPPMTQTPPRSPIRPSSLPHSPSRSPSMYSRPPSIYQNHQKNISITSLPGFTPLKDIRRPSPAMTADSAWRALHPPANQFRHVSATSPTLQRAPAAQGLATIKSIPTSPLLDLVASRSPSIRTGSALPYARGHSRNKSAPYTPININPQQPPSQPSSSSQTPSVSSPPRKRGHVRCTSDPNEMISAHLAAEMDLALRLDRKLQEVSLKLEAQRFEDGRGLGTTATSTTAATTTSATLSSSTRRGPASSASGAGESSGKSSADTEVSLQSSGAGGGGALMMTTAMKKKEARSNNVDLTSSLYARMEWDMLMGKEVNVLD